MKRRILIIIMTVLLAVVSTFTITYALFQMNKNFDIGAQAGHITLASESYYGHQYTNGVIVETNPITSIGDGYENGYVTCFASQRRNSDIENYYYLNQLSYKIEFKNDIDIRLRIKVQDSWISRKLYSNNVIKEGTVIKDYENDPFSFTSSNWTFDVNSGYVYYKYIIKPGKEVDGVRSSITKELYTNPNYFYQVTDSVGYKETVMVKISFKVDMVQANRVHDKWGNDIPSATYE